MFLNQFASTFRMRQIELQLVDYGEQITVGPFKCFLREKRLLEEVLGGEQLIPQNGDNRFELADAVHLSVVMVMWLVGQSKL